MLFDHLTLSDFFPLINIFIILPICILAFSYSIKINLLTDEMSSKITKKYLWLTNILDYLIIALLLFLYSIFTNKIRISDEFLIYLLIIFTVLPLSFYLNYISIKNIFKKIEAKNKTKLLYKILLYPIISIGLFVIYLNIQCNDK
ncbi:hypothetical protein CH354_18245 [Leptospira levettii]|nr:hypothetical protein CH354_18245 [Leptospira levettii]